MSEITQEEIVANRKSIPRTITAAICSQSNYSEEDLDWFLERLTSIREYLETLFKEQNIDPNFSFKPKIGFDAYTDDDAHVSEIDISMSCLCIRCETDDETRTRLDKERWEEYQKPIQQNMRMNILKNRVTILNQDIQTRINERDKILAEINDTPISE